MDSPITYSHRLILPADANHRQTLYAGTLLRLALEACYASAARAVGREANLVLRRVLSLECARPVAVGEFVEIQSVPLHLARAYLVIGVRGTLPTPEAEPWMDGLLGFAQVDEEGRPAPLPEQLSLPKILDPVWQRLQARCKKLVNLRS